MPSEQKMLFFTPELYLRFNSPDEDAALAADVEWEAAIVRYHQYLATLHEDMPAQVVELSKLCLHDGEILHPQKLNEPLSSSRFEDGASSPGSQSFWCGLATLGVKLDDELVTIFYALCDRIAEQPAPKDWPFSKKREHWLYDEIHQFDRGKFAHLILLSSGVVMTIPFSTVLISRFRLSPMRAKNDKQSA